MKDRLKSLLKIIIVPIDYLISPLVFISAVLLARIRKTGFKHHRFSRKVLTALGMLPVIDHYYEPLFQEKHLRKPLKSERVLPGIDLRVEYQLQIMEKLKYGHEMAGDHDQHLQDRALFRFDNGHFDAGDAEFWYNMIRWKKPSMIIEVGCGHSTKVAVAALKNNFREVSGYTCEHICIEPYEVPWLEQLPVKVLRQKVESVDLDVFRNLEDGDLLFIDSSHVIRPQGDVLFEYLEILPSLKPGVIIHIHDVFTPRDYPALWVLEEIRLWNEQYLLEAFLSFNSSFQVLASLNHLKHQHFTTLQKVCPMMTERNEPSSFYIERNQ